MNDIALIEALKKSDRKAQKKLYNKYAGLFLSICRRYIKNVHDAEDVLLTAMVKIFSNISQFHNQGSFEGWMKRIVVNEALMFLRKKNNFNISLDSSHYSLGYTIDVEDKLILEDLLKLLEFLPIGYRTIFNLYVIEGYKHREIAEMLGISINTSKSQLILAKKRLRVLIKKKQYPNVS